MTYRGIIQIYTFQAFAIENVDDQKDEINFYVIIIVVTGLFAGLFTLLMVSTAAIKGIPLISLKIT